MNKIYKKEMCIALSLCICYNCLNDEYGKTFVIEELREWINIIILS